MTGQSNPAQSDARCQHCPCLADERSFMCEDCASQADHEVQELRDRGDALAEAIKRSMGEAGSPVNFAKVTLQNALHAYYHGGSR